MGTDKLRFASLYLYSCVVASPVKAEPVKEVDLPGKASRLEAEVLASAVAALAVQFPHMFKDSVKCKRPHMHVDNLRDSLFQAKVVSALELRSDEDLLLWLLERNAELGARTDEQWFDALAPSKGSAAKAPAKSVVEAVKKSRLHGFFLGLDPNWLTAQFEE